MRARAVLARAAPQQLAISADVIVYMALSSASRCVAGSVEAAATRPAEWRLQPEAAQSCDRSVAWC